MSRDFLEFKARVEGNFGSLDFLAEKEPDNYVHLVLNHGFLEYIRGEGLSLSDLELKQKYLAWAKENNLAEDLLEEGWEMFLRD